MKATNILEKAGASVVNAAIAFIVSSPLYFVWGFSIEWKWSVIAALFLVEFAFFIFGQDRDLGMRVVGSRWRGRYSLGRHFIYNILYTLSFSTLFFHIWFPFDLFLINMLCIQLPTVLLTGTTFHGYLAGLETVKPQRVVQ